MGTKWVTLTAAIGLAAGMGMAGEDATLTVNDEMTLVTKTKAPAHMENVDEIYSGWTFRSDETQALQMDDFDNPAFVFVDTAMDLFDTPEGTQNQACSSCHESVEDFAGLSATLPRVNADGELETLTELVNGCRTERMGAEEWKYSGAQMSAMTALISLQSRGMPMNVAIDGPAQSFWEAGKELYYTRVGQLDMACSNCHEDNYGIMIRADHLSQGQINGFPTYRLKNAKINTTHGRFKGCMKNIRATPYKEGGDEFKALELYVASRGNGLSVEAPSVRN
ncbi:sulfur oxidation c-type cytochrome SoxA [Thalassococcus sp. S3]|uniref:sulfur oxidation c-type cytochrome SoxA n=1 Tax=Thalassococcus sp. S3 TaxID=2017482 RepID=UPI0010247BD7|nr:sulfur oxidation c-type cytochrome SoxA [Thalassococcus sp. S3]